MNYGSSETAITPPFKAEEKDPRSASHPQNPAFKLVGRNQKSSEIATTPPFKAELSKHQLTGL
jgi:hypothetical protein